MANKIWVSIAYRWIHNEKKFGKWFFFDKDKSWGQDFNACNSKKFITKKTSDWEQLYLLNETYGLEGVHGKKQS